MMTCATCPNPTACKQAGGCMKKAAGYKKGGMVKAPTKKAAMKPAMKGKK